jgi:hypothetical protein
LLKFWISEKTMDAWPKQKPLFSWKKERRMWNKNKKEFARPMKPYEKPPEIRTIREMPAEFQKASREAAEKRKPQNENLSFYFETSIPRPPPPRYPPNAAPPHPFRPQSPEPAPAPTPTTPAPTTAEPEQKEPGNDRFPYKIYQAKKARIRQKLRRQKVGRTMESLRYCFEEAYSRRHLPMEKYGWQQ